MPGKDLACSQTCVFTKTCGGTPCRLLLKEAGAPLKGLVKDTQFAVGVPHGSLALLTKVRSHLHHNPTHVAAQLDFQDALYWIKLISRLPLKEAGAPLKDLDTQFGVGVPHGSLALLTKAQSHLHHNPTHVAAQLDFQNAFGTMHRKACIAQLEKHINSQEPWLPATKNLWSRNVATPHPQEEDLFETADGVPQGDPLSTLVFAMAMSLLLKDSLQNKAPDVSTVAYVDDTVLLGTAASVTQAITEIQAETATGGLKLEKAKAQVWSPTQQSIDNEPLLRTLQGRMGDKRGILVLGETVSEETEDAIAIPIGNEAFVTDHIKQKLLDDLSKVEHLPHTLVGGEAGLQTAWGLLRRTVPSRFLHVLRGHAVEITADFCDEIQESLHRILGQWTDQGGGLTTGQQRIVELPIEHGGLGFLPVKDLAAIARLSALASLPDNPHTRSFREASYC